MTIRFKREDIATENWEKVSTLLLLYIYTYNFHVQVYLCRYKILIPINFHLMVENIKKWNSNFNETPE